MKRDRRLLHRHNREDALELLGSIMELFDKHGIAYYLDFGTLLGAVRDGSLLDWDDDVDITLYEEKDFHKIPSILKEIEARTGYIVKLYTIKHSQEHYAHEIEKYVEPREIKFTCPSNYHIAKIKNRSIYIPQDVNISLDIFFQYKHRDRRYWFMFGKVYSIPAEILSSGFKEIDFHGVKCRVPINYEEYLNHIFGRNWKTPDDEWDEEKSPALEMEYRGIKPLDNRFMHKRNRIEMIKLFKLVDSVLKKHNIAYYLDFGTLIGAVRDGDLIPWDDDMDISLIHERDFKKLPKVVKEIKMRRPWYFAKTFTFKHSQTVYEASEKMYVKKQELDFTDNKNIQIAIVKNSRRWRPGKGNAVLDIFCKYKHNDKLYWMAFGKVYEMRYEPLEKGFKKINFLGIECLIPKAYDEYLSQHYGNWRKPNEQWQQEDSQAMKKEYKKQ